MLRKYYKQSKYLLKKLTNTTTYYKCLNENLFNRLNFVVCIDLIFIRISPTSQLKLKKIIFFQIPTK